mmetsp:Transcript_2274/g.7609  ORF Transcript_2274/g.7609 Transcript_2274/m.7609 type:complete len:210 (+) Transcript_2274:1641-2270(+)
MPPFLPPQHRRGVGLLRGRRRPARHVGQFLRRRRRRPAAPFFEILFRAVPREPGRRPCREGCSSASPFDDTGWRARATLVAQWRCSRRLAGESCQRGIPSPGAGTSPSRQVAAPRVQRLSRDRTLPSAPAATSSRLLRGSQRPQASQTPAPPLESPRTHRARPRSSPPWTAPRAPAGLPRLAPCRTTQSVHRPRATTVSSPSQRQWWVF